MKRLREWISIKTIKAPDKIVLLLIMLANVVVIGISAFAISVLAPATLENSGFWSSVFNMITMVLGVGGVDTVIEDIGSADVVLVIACIVAIIIGMVVFTGAIIGYMTDLISGFIEDADSSSRKLTISDHIVILNWNTRAAEIINEILYKQVKEKIVVLISDDKEDVLRDIDERISDTLKTEHEELVEVSKKMGLFKRWFFMQKNKIHNKLTIIIREGDSWSTKQLNDISIGEAKSIIILSTDITDAYETFDYKDKIIQREKGNANTIKTLVQVVQLATEEQVCAFQQIVVEVEDDWTLDLVETIIEHKSLKGKCNITPIPVNRILGQIFSQFSIMPELNIAYSSLFSNKGASFYSQVTSLSSLTEEKFVSEYFGNHSKAIPLTVMKDKDGELNCYYLANKEEDIYNKEIIKTSDNVKLILNDNFELKDKHVIILGHNSKSSSIMVAFNDFQQEWKRQDGSDVLEITIIDNEENLKKQNYYKQYSFVKKVVTADVYDKDLICLTIEKFVDNKKGDKCILVLSDDTVIEEEVDMNALTYLILVQNIIAKKIAEDSKFDQTKLDMVVEILNPRNYDVVSQYSSNNIVISNRYISKMIMQIGEKGSLFDFYHDILTYDDPDEEDADSKELYIKNVEDFFTEIPETCNTLKFVRAVYTASPANNKSIVLGYITPEDKMILFGGKQLELDIKLSKEDKLIIFSNH